MKTALGQNSVARGALAVALCLVALQERSWSQVINQPAAETNSVPRATIESAKEMAAQGDPVAQNTVGEMYAEGNGIKQDYREAARWFRKAAEQGNADAQGNLAAYYDDYVSDYAEAARWYRKAAEQGSVTAQNRLGEMYVKGLGVPEDLDEGIKWFQKAAEHGHEQAKVELARTIKRKSTKESWKQSQHRRELSANAANLSPTQRSDAISLQPLPQSTNEITTIKGQTYRGVKVLKAEPDGLVVEFVPDTGGVGISKIKFEILSDSLKQQYGYDLKRAAEFETAQAQALVQWRAQQAQWHAKLKVEKQAQARAEQARLEFERMGQILLERIKAEIPTQVQPWARSRDANELERVNTLTALVVDYHKSHTYLGGGIFACADMACDVWNMVFTKGINAKIQIGNVEKDISSSSEANHAWVLVEVSPGKWLALETTGGYTVEGSKNPRYYSGWSFSNPKEFREKTADR